MNKILSLLLIFLILISIGSAFAKENTRGVEDIRTANLPLNESEIQQMVDKTKSTNPEYFQNISQASYTVASYGTVPLKNGEEAYDWQLSLHNIAGSIQQDQAFGKYSATNDGPINGYSSNVYGFILISLNPETDKLKTTSDIEAMKQIIETYAEKEGINDIPIVFVNGKSNLVLDPAEKYTLSEEPNGFLSFFTNYYLRFFDKFK